MNITHLHIHSVYSLLDSTTQYEEYVKKAVEYGMKAIASTEHGNVFANIKKKKICDEYGIKYIHGCEMYLTKSFDEKLRDNYHVILLAKNYEGIKELNELVTLSTDDNHSYYKPRLSFEEFCNISNNIITTSACLGGVLANIDEDDEWFEKLMNRFDYLEIQPHLSSRQKEYNKKLLYYKNKYNKPFVLGCDVHEIDKYHEECRAIWQKGKGIEYDDMEDFDLSFKSYEQIYEMCKKQDCFDISFYDEAIENTNIIADMIEDYKLDLSFKYTNKYNDAVNLIRNRVYDAYNEKYKIGAVIREEEEEYFKQIENELDVFNKVGMESFILFMSDESHWEIKNDIITGFGRGSCCGSLVAYLLDITDVDPVRWGTVFSRFCNEERVSLGDIDKDYSPKDREKVFNHIREEFGDSYSSYIGTFQKLKVAKIVEDVGRALGKSVDEIASIKSGYNEIDKNISKLEKLFDDKNISLDEYKERKEVLEKEMNNYLSEFEDIFYYYKGLNGCIGAVGFHPSGIIGSPINIRESISLRYNKKNDSWISQCDMKEVDGCNYVKYDILSLKTMQVLTEAFKLANKEYPRAYQVNWNDIDVFEDMLSSSVGLFQMESDSAFAYLKKFKPTSVEDITLLTAVIRPSCASFRENVFNREIHPTPSKVIEEVLKNSYGYLVYQEQQIAFLQKACGFTGGQADTVRRAIGKKDPVLLAKWLPVIKEGYINNSDKSKEEAEKEVEEFMKIFIDSASYSFGFNHATAYSMITYMTAYCRKYHTIEFITAYLNNASNDDDIVAGTNLAKLYGIEICNPKFGMSSGKYLPHNNKIYKGVESILNVSKQCGDDLYNLSKKYDFKNKTFLDVLILSKEEKCAVDKTNITTLIKVGYFSDFGKIHTLLKAYDIYSKYMKRKTISKDDMQILQNICIKRIKSGDKDFVETKSKFKIEPYKFCSDLISLIPEKDASDEEKIIYQLSYLNYIQDIELFKYNVGYVKWISTKNNSACIENFGSKKESWYNLGTYALNKDDIVKINLSSKIKDGNKMKNILIDIDILELDRRKEKK